MAITQLEGNEIAAQFMTAFSEGFAQNNHSETMKDLLADELMWSWPKGTAGEQGECGREGSTKELMGIMKEKWGSLIGSWVFSKPTVCIDTNQSRIVIASHCVFTITGGLADECSNSLILNENVWSLMLNDDKKVIRWSMVWDPNNKQFTDAIAKVMEKQGKEVPKAEMPDAAPLTLEEGQAFAKDFMTACAAGFTKNNHAETFTQLFADKLSWGWSNGTKGEGSYDELMEIVSKDWGSMVTNCLYAEPIVAVDTSRSIVAIVATIFLNVTGGLSDESNPVMNNCTYIMHLNEDKKCCKWHMSWDANDIAFKGAFSRVAKRLEAVSKVAEGDAVDSSVARVVAGQ